MKLKSSLLFQVLDNHYSTNRYSKAYINLKNVIELETQEKHKLSKSILENFGELTKQYDSFTKGIPLIIIERYYNDHKEKLNKYCNLRYKTYELSEVQIMDLFIQLEDYFNLCFSLAVQIASLYNLEIKINKGYDSEEGYL